MACTSNLRYLRSFVRKNSIVWLFPCSRNISTSIATTRYSQSTLKGNSKVYQKLNLKCMSSNPVTSFESEQPKIGAPSDFALNYNIKVKYDKPELLEEHQGLLEKYPDFKNKAEKFLRANPEDTLYACKFWSGHKFGVKGKFSEKMRNDLQQIFDENIYLRTLQIYNSGAKHTDARLEELAIEATPVIPPAKSLKDLIALHRNKRPLHVASGWDDMQERRMFGEPYYEDELFISRLASEITIPGGKASNVAKFYAQLGLVIAFLCGMGVYLNGSKIVPPPRETAATQD